MTLAVGPIFASRWLIPRLNRFRRQHPGIELVLHHGPRISAVQDMITDVAVDWGTGGWSDLDSGRLICPLDIALEPTRSYHLLTRPGARKNVEIESVCAWLANEADIARKNRRGKTGEDKPARINGDRPRFTNLPDRHLILQATPF